MTEPRTKHRLTFRFNFNDFPEPFVQMSSGVVDVLFVTTHSEQEERMVFPLGSRGLGIRPGNFSDYEYVPTLAANLAHTLHMSHRGGNFIPPPLESMKMITDIQLDMEKDVPNRNLITIGAGNVNAFTRRVFEDAEKLFEEIPVHFEAASGHDLIVSEISHRTWVYGASDSCLLVMFPNFYSKRDDKVILVVAGTEIEQTVAGIMSLCVTQDPNGRRLQDDNTEAALKGLGRIPAKVVRAIRKPVEVASVLDQKGGFLDVVGFEFLE